MTRFVTKLAAGATALALAGAPGVATAQSDNYTVDEKTGPVAYVNIASSVADSPEKPTPVSGQITTTQRSPLRPGQSKVGPERNHLPQDADETSNVGKNHLWTLGAYDAEKGSPYPEGVASRIHDAKALLKDTTVPAASAETNYALQDQAIGGNKPIDNTVLVLEGARTAVECAAKDKITSETSVQKIRVRKDLDPDKPLTEEKMPADGSELVIEDLPIGVPFHDAVIPKHETSSSTVTIKRLSDFDELLRQKEWRGGEVNAAAGWIVEVTTFFEDAEGKTVHERDARYVLGGVSCSIPRDFVAKTPASNSPKVPTKIPAGDTDDTSTLGLSLLGGGALLGAGAVMMLRRRRETAEVRVND